MSPICLLTNVDKSGLSSKNVSSDTIIMLKEKNARVPDKIIKKLKIKVFVHL
jgi:hypothetical protein